MEKADCVGEAGLPNIVGGAMGLDRLDVVPKTEG